MELIKSEIEECDKSDTVYKELLRRLQIIEQMFLSYKDIIRDYKINRIL
jgi:hypothetical protein